MLDSFPTGFSKRRLTLLSVSIAAHGLLLVWLGSASYTKILAPSSVAAGAKSGSVTAVYWPAPGTNIFPLPGVTTTQKQRERQPLTWKKEMSIHSIHKVQPPEVGVESPVGGNPVPPAGAPYGSQGPGFGDEVRPALPVYALDPVVDPNELPGHVEGSIVVEITIDEQGNIVQKTVLQSLGPAIDTKVLAALENWHFRPATRNGIAIPSKQDVHYHFKPVG